MAIQSHRDLIVWQKSMELVVQVYQVSKSFPKEEMYGITSQVRRAAVSVPANLAEGNARSTRKDYASFVSISRGSLSETETLLLLTLKLGFATQETLQPIFALMDEIGRMLTKLRSSLAKDH